MIAGSSGHAWGRSDIDDANERQQHGRLQRLVPTTLKAPKHLLPKNQKIREKRGEEGGVGVGVLGGVLSGVP